MKKTCLAAILLLGLLSSCETTEVVYDPQETLPEFTAPTPQEFTGLQSQALENITQEFTFDANAPITNYTSAKGVVVSIYGGCFTKNGIPVTGNVDLEFIELFDRGNMLVTNKATMGVLPGGEQRLLISGGEFYINVTQNGEQLELPCGFQLTVPASLSGGLDTDMTSFSGTIDAAGNMVWNSSQTEFWAGGENNQEPFYNAFLQDFGWFNCDKFASFDGPMTDIQVFVPEGYTEANSNIFIAIPGEPNTLGYLSGQFPVGLECYLIFVTANADGGFAYAIKTVTLTADASYSFTSDEIEEVTTAELIALINALP